VNPVTPSPRWSLSRLSLEQKLPLLICALLLAVVLAYAAAAYQAVRRATFAAARERLVSVTEQLSGLLRGSAVQLRAATRTVAGDAAVGRYLRSPSRNAPARAAAVAALGSIGPQPDQVASVELWDASANPVLRVPRHGPSIGPDLEREAAALASSVDSSAVGRFSPVGDSIVYPVVARVATGNRTAGYVVQWRRIASSPQGRSQTLQLIGSGASLYITNDRGDFWMDLIHAVPKPPVDARLARGIVTYQRPDSGPVLALARPVAGTPWFVLLEFPERGVTAQVHLFLWPLAVIALVLVVAGLGGAWALSRRIAAPLRELTDAAVAIAGGDYERRVTVHRDDELGQLAAAFNIMAGRVRESQQRLEEQVEQRTAALQERNDELEAFGYSISHDLRAPLRAMHGFGEALLEDYGDRFDDTGRDYAQRIVSAARRMDDLIRDLLAYSRVGRTELRLAPVPLAQVVAYAIAQLHADLEGRGAKVTVAEPLPSVVGHEAMLSQAVMNLVANAVKFVAPGRTPEVRIHGEPASGRVRLWVEDNGIGIAPEHHDRIFRVFERLHRMEDYPGTGIGLAIVRKTVERMGGLVGVDSAPDQGSKFWIDLPAAED
jgi:signal transduction histidine kinase